jgi:hypothetical protein
MLMRIAIDNDLAPHAACAAPTLTRHGRQPIRLRRRR